MKSHTNLDMPQNDLDLLTTLIKKRESADILWEEAISLHKEAAAEEKYQLAHGIYIECHQLLTQFLDSKNGIENLLTNMELLYETECERTPVIIGLYFTAKTLADAYLIQDEFVEAYSLYLLAATLLKNCFKNTLTNGWLETVIGDMDGIRTNIKYNAALCLLYYYESMADQKDNDFFSIKQINQASSRLIYNLNDLRLADKISINELTTVTQNILRSRIMYGNAPIRFHSPRHMDYLRWSMQSVLTPAQMVKLIKLELSSKIDFFELIHDSNLNLSDQQHSYIKENIVGKENNNTVRKNAIEFAKHLKIFSESQEYEKFTLKKHQKTAFNLLMNHFSEGQTKAGIKMATGTGKTRVYITQLLAMYHDMPENVIATKRTLIVVPRLSLSEQTAKRIQELVQLSGIEVNVAQFNGVSKQQSQITIISLQSLISEMRKLPQHRKIDLDLYVTVVFDEIHEALTQTCKDLVHELEKSKIILTFTATDTYNTVRRKGCLKSVSELLGEENCIYHYPLLQGINDKVLSPLRVCLVNGLKQIPQRKRVSAKEFNMNEMSNELAKDNYHEINATITELYLNLPHPDTGRTLNGKKTFIFCVNIQHAKILTEMLSKYGVSAAAISGEMDQKSQVNLLDQFQNRKINVLCCADLLNAGIDVPSLEIIINARPTKSFVLAEQRLGRVTRLNDKKICGLVIEIQMSEGQVLATKFIDHQWFAGELKPLLNENTQCKREDFHKENLIMGACNWVVSWNGLVPKKNRQTYFPNAHTQNNSGLLPHAGLFNQPNRANLKRSHAMIENLQYTPIPKNEQPFIHENGVYFEYDAFVASKWIEKKEEVIEGPPKKKIRKDYDFYGDRNDNKLLFDNTDRNNSYLELLDEDIFLEDPDKLFNFNT